MLRIQDVLLSVFSHVSPLPVEEERLLSWLLEWNFFFERRDCWARTLLAPAFNHALLKPVANPRPRRVFGIRKSGTKLIVVDQLRGPLCW